MECVFSVESEKHNRCTLSEAESCTHMAQWVQSIFHLTRLTLEREILNKLWNVVEHYLPILPRYGWCINSFLFHWISSIVQNISLSHTLVLLYIISSHMQCLSCRVDLKLIKLATSEVSPECCDRAGKSTARLYNAKGWKSIFNRCSQWLIKEMECSLVDGEEKCMRSSCAHAR